MWQRSLLYESYEGRSISFEPHQEKKREIFVKEKKHQTFLHIMIPLRTISVAILQAPDDLLMGLRILINKNVSMAS